MRLSEIQRRRSLPAEAQPIPPQRVALWLLIGLAVAAGIYLYFRSAGGLTALLDA